MTLPGFSICRPLTSFSSLSSVFPITHRGFAVLDLSQGKSIRLLVIEGDEQLTAQIYAYLEPLGYVLDSASNGMLGWQRAVSEAYDALLIDVMLPGMDGLTLCRRLRTESGSEIPVIMMTSSESVENRVLCLNWGADDFLVKPFDFLEMQVHFCFCWKPIGFLILP